MTSLLRGVPGLPARAAALLLEVDDEDEKFFWDLVTEPFSKVPSSFPVALRMLLNEQKEEIHIHIYI